MEEIFLQVEEDLKQKQLKEFWEENKNWIIGGVIGSIIATGSMSGYRKWENNRNIRETSSLSAIVEKIDSGDVAELNNFISETNKNHALIARLVLAATYIEKNEIANAVEIYNQIATTKGIDSNYRDYAKLLSVKHRATELSSAEVINETKSLENTNWKHLAIELQALSLAKEGKYKEAIEELNRLTFDAYTPNSLRARAQKLTELYSAKIE